MNDKLNLREKANTFNLFSPPVSTALDPPPSLTFFSLSLSYTLFISPSPAMHTVHHLDKSACNWATTANRSGIIGRTLLIHLLDWLGHRSWNARRDAGKTALCCNCTFSTEAFHSAPRVSVHLTTFRSIRSSRFSAHAFCITVFSFLGFFFPVW